jgi:hypothetical protein
MAVFHSRLEFMDNRGICQRGSHRELMVRGGPYAELYRARFSPEPAPVKKGSKDDKKIH